MNAQDHWNAGRHSNIPVCCIVWFLARQRLPNRYIEWSERVRRMWYHQSRSYFGFYVRCPWCVIVNRWNVIHPCTEECRGVKGSSNRVNNPSPWRTSFPIEIILLNEMKVKRI